MNEGGFSADMIEMLTDFKSLLIEFLPRILTAIGLILLGILIAYVFRAVINRLMGRIYLIIPGQKIRGRVRYFLEEKPITRVIGGVVFWVLIFFFLAAATETLGLPVVTSWLGGLVGYLPRILSAALVGIAGIVGGYLLRELIITTTTTAGIAFGSVLAKLVHAVILLVTVLIAMDQIGIDVTLLNSVVITAIGALLFGAALAFGLGANTSVSNILTAFYLQRIYKVGDRVRIGAIEGRIIQITPLAVIIDGPEGQACVPAKEFNESSSVLITKEQ